MKKLKFMLLILTISLSAMAQEKDEEGAEKQAVVPSAVKAAFQKDYPGITNVTWDAEDADFEAGFKKGDIDVSALYDKTGHLKETETGIKTSELPQTVQDYIHKNYSTYQLVEAAKIMTDKKVTTYEAEVGKGGKTWDVMFDANGKFLKQAEGD